MKAWAAALAAAAVLGACAAAPAPAQLTFDLIDLAAISRMTPRELELLAEGLAAEEMIRTKRSSSAQALGQIATKVSSGISSKVSLLGQASAGASSFIASASSKGDEHTGYSYEPHEEKPKYDFWGLKKSILNTLFQAVKAITGGVTIIKGQIIKGGGALASVAGKLISVKGDAVSNLGRKIVNSAQLSPPKKHHAPAPSYGPPPSLEYLPSAYGVPPAGHAPAHYAHSAPSAPSGPGFTAPSKYTSHYEGRKPLSGLHAGVILLRPLESEPAHRPDHHPAPSAAHTALEPPSSLFLNAFKALKGAFKGSQTPDDTEHDYVPSDEHNSVHYPPGPPPPPGPQSSWGTPLNSYGEPADGYFHPYADHGSPDSYSVAMSKAYKKSKGFTPEKLHKLTENLSKIPALQRSSQEVPLLDNANLYREMLEKRKRAQFPNSARSSEAMYLNLDSMTLDSTPPTTPDALAALQSLLHTVAPTTDRPTTTTTEAARDQTPAASSNSSKYALRGNRIVQV